jgi:DNA polymerase-3 subunit delta
VKIPAARIESALDRPNPEWRAALIYGPDAGLVRERAERLRRATCGDPKDPFRVAEITSAALAEDPELLFVESAQLSLLGGPEASRRLTRLREASDALGGLFQAFFKAAPRGDGFILVEAGDLSSRSSLRRAFEATPAAAAVPCYPDTVRDLENLVRDVMGAHAIRVSTDAAEYLATHLGGDRGVSRQELEKLALYAGDGGAVALEDATVSVGDSAAMALDDVVMAAAEGDPAVLERALDRLYQEGAHAVTVLRAAARHFLRLHLLAAKIEQGANPDEAVRSLRPPLFFKLQDRVKAQARRWPSRRVQAALDLLLEAELNAKRSGPPPEAICRDALLRIARRAAEARPRGR